MCGGAVGSAADGDLADVTGQVLARCALRCGIREAAPVAGGQEIYREVCTDGEGTDGLRHEGPTSKGGHTEDDASDRFHSFRIINPSRDRSAA